MLYLIILLTIIVSVIIGTYLSLRINNVERGTAILFSFLIPRMVISFLIFFERYLQKGGLNSTKKVKIDFRLSIKLRFRLILLYADVVAMIGLQLYDRQQKETRATVRNEINIRSTYSNIKKSLDLSYMI